WAGRKVVVVVARGAATWAADAAGRWRAAAGTAIAVATHGAQRAGLLAFRARPNGVLAHTLFAIHVTLRVPMAVAAPVGRIARRAIVGTRMITGAAIVARVAAKQAAGAAGAVG